MGPTGPIRSSAHKCSGGRGSTTGKITWKTFTVSDPAIKTKVSSAGTQLFGPSGAGIWDSQTIDTKRKLVYAGTGNNYSDPPTNTSDAVLAFDIDSGALKWSKQLTEDAWNASCGRPDKPSCPANPDPDVDVGSSPILRKLSTGMSSMLVQVRLLLQRK